MWLDKKEMSSYAFNNFSENPDLVSCITDPFYVYLYCKTIKDDPRVSRNLKFTKQAVLYCLFINRNVNPEEFIEPSYLEVYYKTIKKIKEKEGMDG